jgi:abhydrolase domain-containing protein 12
MGLWAGYRAALVLTLSPSMTFYLQDVLGKLLVDGSREGGSGGATFLVAAVSRVIATVMTYPFRRTKAISQVSAPEGTKLEPAEEDIEEPESRVKAFPGRLHRLAEESILRQYTR